MVTGNFALLLGVHPDELDQWYLGIYMDAIEWVEITNTGDEQFADGGYRRDQALRFQRQLHAQDGRLLLQLPIR